MGRLWAQIPADLRSQPTANELGQELIGRGFEPRRIIVQPGDEHRPFERSDHHLRCLARQTRDEDGAVAAAFGSTPPRATFH